MKTTVLQDRRFWLAGTAAFALLLIAIAWFFLISPKRSDTAALRSQIGDVQLQNDTLQAKNSALVRANRHLPDLQARLRAALTALPGTDDLSTFTRAVSSTATASHVTLTSVTIGADEPVLAATSAVPSAAPTAESGSSPSAAPSATPVAAPTSSAPASQYSVAVSVSCTGTRAADSNFLRALQHGQRSTLVTSSVLTATGGSTVTMTTQLQIFTAPMSAAELAQVHRLLTARS